MAETLKLGTNGIWATKEGSLLAYNDENGNYKPLPFDFTRASSATVVNKDGLIEIVGGGVPRIDFTDDANGALLLEPQRTNECLKSQDYGISDWTQQLINVTADATISPSGLNDATKVAATATNSNHYLERKFYTGAASSTLYTYSCFAKSSGSDYCQIALSSGFGSGYQNFNLSNGTLAANNLASFGYSASIESYGNGWYRVSVTAANNAGGEARFLCVPILTDTTRNPSFVGNGTDGFYTWGHQLEQGSYANSYIPTQGSAVTRIADACNNGGNDQVINSAEGVLYVEMAALADDSTNRQITLQGADASNRLVLKYDNQSNIIQAFNRVGGAETAFLGATVSDITNFNKVAIKYKLNNYALWINGVEVDTDVSSTTWVANTLTDLRFSDGGSSFYGNVRDLKLYNTALTDQELIALTSQ
jgi:hypothetical protein